MKLKIDPVIRTEEDIYSLIDEHFLGIIPNGWTFSVGNTYTAIAICRFDICRIEFSKHFIGRITRKFLKEALFHEIAHAIVGGNSEDNEHGSLWKKQMEKFGYPQAQGYIQVLSLPDFRFGIFDKNDQLIRGFYRKPFSKTILKAVEDEKSFKKIQKIG